jgi:spermidine synthase
VPVAEVSLMNGRRSLPILLLLFVGSGSAALVYEVVWFQLLQLVIGVSAISLGVLLGTFMGGLFLGSLLFPRFVPATRHPLRVYAVIELSIGAIGLLVLVVVPLVGGIYTAWAGSGMVGVFLRAAAAGICLLPPTVLMGATLPALGRWVEATPKGASWLGFFYAANTTGAVLGCLLAGFYLLRVTDITTATFVAVGLNVLVAVASLAVALLVPHAAATTTSAAAADVPGASAIYIATALSGLTGLAAEVVWTRMLSLLIGGTTYTFSLILAAFLLGIGIGSAAGAGLAKDPRRARLALGWCQAALCLGIAWAAYMLSASLPFWPIDPSLADSPWFNFQIDFVRSLWAVLPATLLWGASFPLAISALMSEGQDPARLVSRVYAANTVGAIVGSLGASLFLISRIGSQHTQQLLILLTGISALVVLEPVAGPAVVRRSWLRFAVVVVVVMAGAGTLMTRAVPPVPGLLVAYGRFTATKSGQGDVLYSGEGLSSSVAVTRLGNGILSYHNAGKVQASSDPEDMRLQRMLGHITTLTPAHPKSVLVIGCGAGVTAGAVSVDPTVEKVTIAEIEPLVITTVSKYFSRYNHDVIRNPKVTVHVDDARHFLTTTREKFDAITSDPLDPWVKGAAMLYTKEFFELAKRHLNPGGAVTIFVQLYQSNEEAVKSEIGTFFDAFPNGVVFANTVNNAGYDLVLLGQVDPIKIDVDQWQAKLDRPEYQAIAQSLHEIGFPTVVELLGTYSGSTSDLAGWLKDASINHDSNLRLQYLAGMGFNLRQSGTIYNNMLAYRRQPVGLFYGSPASLAALYGVIENPPIR